MSNTSLEKRPRLNLRLTAGISTPSTLQQEFPILHSTNIKNLTQLLLVYYLSGQNIRLSSSQFYIFSYFDDSIRLNKTKIVNRIQQNMLRDVKESRLKNSSSLTKGSNQSIKEAISCSSQLHLSNTTYLAFSL